MYGVAVFTDDIWAFSLCNIQYVNGRVLSLLSSVQKDTCGLSVCSFVCTQKENKQTNKKKRQSSCFWT